MGFKADQRSTRSWGWLVAGITVGVLAVGGGAAALASIPDSNGIFTGCVNPDTGGIPADQHVRRELQPSHRESGSVGAGRSDRPARRHRPDRSAWSRWRPARPHRRYRSNRANWGHRSDWSDRTAGPHG
jgi:hypothetical protein